MASSRPHSTSPQSTTTRSHSATHDLPMHDLPLPLSSTDEEGNGVHERFLIDVDNLDLSIDRITPPQETPEDPREAIEVLITQPSEGKEPPSDEEINPLINTTPPGEDKQGWVAWAKSFFTGTHKATEGYTELNTLEQPHQDIESQDGQISEYSSSSDDDELGHHHHHVPAPAPQGRLDQAKDILWSAVSGFKTRATDIYEHPFSSTLGLLTSGQAVVNAYLNARELPLRIVNAVSSLEINWPMNTNFLRDSVASVSKATKGMFDSRAEFIKNIIAMILGIAGGLSAGALSFGAFIDWWQGRYLAPATAILSFLSNSASRYIGVKRVIKMAENATTNEEARIQVEMLDALNHLNLKKKLTIRSRAEAEKIGLLKSELRKPSSRNNEHLFESVEASENKEPRKQFFKEEDIVNVELELKQLLNLFLKMKTEKWRKKADHHKLTEAHYFRAFFKILRFLKKIEEQHKNEPGFTLFTEKTAAESAGESIHTLLKLLAGSTMFIVAFAFFAQKGKDGVAILLKELFNYDLKLNPFFELMIGAASGLASGSLYGAFAAEFLRLFFYVLPTHLYKHKEHIPAAALLMAFNYFASSSMENVAKSILNREDNLVSPIVMTLLPFMTKEMLLEIAPLLLRLGGFLTNSISGLLTYGPKIHHPNHPLFDSIMAYLADPGRNRLDKEHAALSWVAGHNLSFFHDKEVASPDLPLLKRRPSGIITV